MTNPQNKPKSIATIVLSNTVDIAYPPEKAAIQAVENIVPPIPAYLAHSVGHLRKTSLFTPAHHHRKLLYHPGLWEC